MCFGYREALVRECVKSIMTDQQFRSRVRYVIGPDGSPLTVADLPPRDTKRLAVEDLTDQANELFFGIRTLMSVRVDSETLG